MNNGELTLFLEPLALELGRRQVAQGRVNPFVLIHLVQEASHLPVGIRISRPTRL